MGICSGAYAAGLVSSKADLVTDLIAGAPVLIAPRIALLITTSCHQFLALPAISSETVGFILNGGRLEFLRR